MRQPTPSNVHAHWSTVTPAIPLSPREWYQTFEDALRDRAIPGAGVSRVMRAEGGLLSANREYVRVYRDRRQFDICAAPFGNGFFFSWWHTDFVQPGAWMLVPFFFGAQAWAAWMGWKWWPVLVRKLPFGLQIALAHPWLHVAAGMVAAWLMLMLLCTLARSGVRLIEDVLLLLPGIREFYLAVFKPTTYYVIDTTLAFQSVVHGTVLEAVDGVLCRNGLKALADHERRPIMRDFFD